MGFKRPKEELDSLPVVRIFTSHGRELLSFDTRPWYWVHTVVVGFDLCEVNRSVATKIAQLGNTLFYIKLVQRIH